MPQKLVHISYYGVDPSEDLQRRVHERADALDRMSHRLTGVHVTVRRSNPDRTPECSYAVQVEMHLPHQRIMIGGGTSNIVHRELDDALEEAFESAERALSNPSPQGCRVVRLFPELGYGFVQMSNGTPIYFDESSVVGGCLDGLALGDRVRVVQAETEGYEPPRARTVIRARRERMALDPCAESSDPGKRSPAFHSMGIRSPPVPGLPHVGTRLANVAEQLSKENEE